MKIACISASQVPSPTANSLQMMKACQALAELGHSLRVWVPGVGVLAWEGLASHYGLQTPFDVLTLPAHPRLKRYDFSWAAVRQARAWGADAAYVWPPQAAVLALAAGLPTLLELHGEPEGRLGPAVFRLILSHPGRKRFLPITHALAILIERQFGRPFRPGEVVVSPNGVDLERYANLPSPAEARRQLELPEGFTAGYTGHLYPGRGMHLLVELARRLPQVHFLWVGGRPAELDEWRVRLAEAGLQNVFLAGFVENSRLPLYQAACETLLMPYERQIAGSGGGNSAEYCSPMKMFEYMAAGRAIVSSDLPVISEVLNPGIALLLPPEDAPAWEQALTSLSANPQRRQAMGRQAAEDVQAYTWRMRAARALAGFLKA